MSSLFQVPFANLPNSGWVELAIAKAKIAWLDKKQKTGAIAMPQPLPEYLACSTNHRTQS